MRYPSDRSSKRPFCDLEGRGEALVSFVGSLHLPSLPGSREEALKAAARSAEAFGKAGRAPEAAREALLGGRWELALRVAGFFSSWNADFPDLSKAYSFSLLEGETVVLAGSGGIWMKSRKLDEMRMEEILNKCVSPFKVKVKITLNAQKQARMR